MMAGSSDLAAGPPIGSRIVRNGHTPLRVYGESITAGAVTLMIGIAIHSRNAGPDDFQTRACLEPVYAGLFGTGPGAMDRCLQSRIKLFGARGGGWLRYVRHLETSCPVTIGMQGQAICEFQVKASEDHAHTGGLRRRYQRPN
jgi:hypothetical protein